MAAPRMQGKDDGQLENIWTGPIHAPSFQRTSR
jgi:hypothetical protein